MARFFLVLATIVGVIWALASPARSCSLCQGLFASRTIRQDWERADVVLYGSLANPRLDSGGSGTTELVIERVLKGGPRLNGDNLRTITLARFIPVLDPKMPPRFVVFGNFVQGKLDPHTGRAVRSPALFDYLKGIQELPGKDRTQALQYFGNYLDHEDQVIAQDAFLEFVRSTDAEVGQAARLLSPDKIRRIVQDPRTSEERLSLAAFLLGACGNDRDAALLRSMIDRPTERSLKALDGILGGYIHLQPQQGWDLTLKMLSDRRRPFTQRYAALRTVRFHYGWKPAESKPFVLRGLGQLVDDGEMADLAIEDLRRWRTWDLTARVLAQFGKSSHDAPIVRRGIVRYALSCPLPEARQFIERLRRQDAELVRDLEESLEFEKK
jgi:hypothetical protein